MSLRIVQIRDLEHIINLSWSKVYAQIKSSTYNIIIILLNFLIRYVYFRIIPAILNYMTEQDIAKQHQLWQQVVNISKRIFAIYGPMIDTYQTYELF